MGVVPRSIPIFLRIHRIFCWQFQLQTLLRYGTINPRNWKNFRTIMPLNSRLQLQVPHRGHAPNNRKEVLSHEETHLLGSGGSPAAEPCRLWGTLRFQSIRFLRRFFIFSRSRPAGCLLPRHHGGGSSGSLWGRRKPYHLHRGVPGRFPGETGNGRGLPQLGLGLRPERHPPSDAVAGYAPASVRDRVPGIRPGGHWRA